MTDLVKMMEDIAASLPETSRDLGFKTIREVSLCLTQSGDWEVLAGGHPAVALGEWVGDFYGEGKTAEEALNACQRAINDHH